MQWINNYHDVKNETKINEKSILKSRKQSNFFGFLKKNSINAVNTISTQIPSEVKLK